MFPQVYFPSGQMHYEKSNYTAPTVMNLFRVTHNSYFHDCTTKTRGVGQIGLLVYTALELFQSIRPQGQRVQPITGNGDLIIDHFSGFS
jgi:hypothetical protein